MYLHQVQVKNKGMVRGLHSCVSEFIKEQELLEEKERGRD